MFASSEMGRHYGRRGAGAVRRRDSNSLRIDFHHFRMSHQGACHDVSCSIHAGRCRSFCHDHAGSGARASNGTVAVNVIQDRRCFPLDGGALEPCQGRVVQGKGKMGRVPKAGGWSKSNRSEELVFPGVLHDKLSGGDLRLVRGFQSLDWRGPTTHQHNALTSVVRSARKAVPTPGVLTS